MVILVDGYVIGLSFLDSDEVESYLDKHEQRGQKYSYQVQSIKISHLLLLGAPELSYVFISIITLDLLHLVPHRDWKSLSSETKYEDQEVTYDSKDQTHYEKRSGHLHIDLMAFIISLFRYEYSLLVESYQKVKLVEQIDCWGYHENVAQAYDPRRLRYGFIYLHWQLLIQEVIWHIKGKLVVILILICPVVRAGVIMCIWPRNVGVNLKVLGSLNLCKLRRSPFNVATSVFAHTRMNGISYLIVNGWDISDVWHSELRLSNIRLFHLPGARLIFIKWHILDWDNHANFSSFLVFTRSLVNCAPMLVLSICISFHLLPLARPLRDLTRL